MGLQGFRGRLALAASILALPGLAAAQAQSASPAGRYVKHRSGQAEMWVSRKGAVWTIAIDAGGMPNGAATAADCPVIGIGKLTGEIFTGEIRYLDERYGETRKWNLAPETRVDPGHRLTVTFRGRAARVVAQTYGICGLGDGVSGLYSRR